MSSVGLLRRLLSYLFVYILFMYGFSSLEFSVVMVIGAGISFIYLQHTDVCITCYGDVPLED